MNRKFFTPPQPSPW